MWSPRANIAELQWGGNEVDWSDNGRDGLSLGVHGNYDAIGVDRMRPGFDGLAVVTAVRVQTPVPRISAPSDVDARVRGLGACRGRDYRLRSTSFPIPDLAAAPDSQPLQASRSTISRGSVMSSIA